ncbi:MAG TPA: PD-(D/E)XK nuclease family protein, partial [Myxococcales bacterium]|nr:PD-(D/E)XK nuclease family protein [Myxococcales bacterium]
PGGRAALRRQDRLAFYLACCSARRSLTGCAPRLDDRGRPIQPSSDLVELARVAGLEGPQRLDRAILPLGSQCLDRVEAVWAHAHEAEVTGAEPALSEWVLETEDRERRRRVAISEGRTDPTSGALLVESGHAPIAEALRARLLDRPLTPRILSGLAACGFRAFCELIVRLRLPEERGEQMDPRDGGNVRHRCLRDAFAALARAGLLPLVGGERRGRELEVFLGAARAALDAYEAEAPVGHPLVWAAERRTIERQLRRVYGRELSDPGWTPTWFELPFAAGSSTGQLSLFDPSGRPESRPALRLELATGHAFLGGRLDRVDQKPGALRVIDYKTSGLPSLVDRLRHGFRESDLQLAIYALLAREGLAPGADVDAVYLSLTDAKVGESLGEIGSKAGTDLGLFFALDAPRRERCRAEGLPNLAERIGELVERALRGDFPVTPGDCRGCDYFGSCRVGAFYEEWE